MIRYFSVAQDQVQEIVHSITWNSTTDPAFGYELPQDVIVLPPTLAMPNHYKVLRSYFERSYWDSVAAACLDSTPTAGVTVARLSSTGTVTCAGNPTHATAAKGFPGDQFRITNTSGGQPTPTVESIVITGVDANAGNTGYTSGNLAGQLMDNQLTWTSGTGLFGEFQVTLTASGVQAAAVEYIYLCPDPEAKLAVSHYSAGAAFLVCNNCTWLQGYTLRLSALASEGTPDWTNPTPAWTVEYRPTGGNYGAASSGDYVVGNGDAGGGDGTLDLTLNATGDYRVTVNPEYEFAEAPDDTEALEMHSGAITATIAVAQGATAIPNGGTALRSQVTTLTGNGQCASGQACAFTWGGDAASACSTPAGSPPFVCTVASNGFTAGAKTVSLNGTANPSADAVSASTSFTVSDCASPGAPVNSSPAAGASVPAGNVTLSWVASSGTQPIQYTVKTVLGATLCAQTPSTSCTISVSSGTTNWFVQAVNACGNINSSSTSFSVAGSQCTSPGAPSLSSPANGASVAAGSVSFSWTSVSGSTPITYSVRNSVGTTLCSSSGTSCSATLAASSLNWFVTAANACGSTNSGTRSLTVTGGSSCTSPGTPNLSSPANGAQLPAGSVAFSWSAVSGTTPITYTVRSSPFGAQLCQTTGTSCSANMNSSISWFVQASNECSTTNSATRSLSIGPTCTAPGAASLTSPANAATGVGATPALTWLAPTSGTTPFTYDVYLDGVPVSACSNLTVLTCTLPAQPLNSNTRSWYVLAKNSCPASATSQSRTFTTCGQTTVPVANFSWTPTGALTMANGYQQAQPYVGQLVTLTNTSTNGPLTDVNWYDFGIAGGVGTIKTTSTSYTWPTSGNKNVRLNVSNCFGQSAETTKAVPIAVDSRPVVAEFLVSPDPPIVGTPITFTARTGALYGDPDDFTWKFSDEDTTRSGVSISRTFTCSKEISLQLTSKSIARNKTSTPFTLTGAVSGQPLCCSATAVPSATFSWQETGALAFQGMQQQQPYVGQLVHFTDPSPSSATSWRWEIATQPTDNSPTTDKTDHLPTHTFLAPGAYKVRFIPSNCAGSGAPVEKTVTVYDDVRPVTSDFTWSPGGAPAGTAITFTAKDGFNYGDPDTFDWTFPDSVKKSGKAVTHTFTCGGANQVSLVAKRAAVTSQAMAKTVTTTGEPSCCKPPNRAGTPVPTSGATIPGGTVVLQWVRPTKGTDPLTYDVYLDGAQLPECSNLAERQCTIAVEDGTATRFWKVIAKNECGDTTTYPDTPPEWRFKACSQPTAPDATAFTWDKTGPIEVQGVVQQQPYVGQKVTFSYDPTVPATSWSWTDYQVLPAAVYQIPHPEIVYGSAGKKKMYLRTSNCAGTRQITHYIDVFADVRPVEARFSFSPPAPQSLDPVTFTFDTSDEVGNPNEFTIDFGDGTPPLVTTETTAQHAYGCSKLYRVTVTAKRSKPGSSVSSQPHTEDLEVEGYPCSASALVVIDMVRELDRTSGVIERGDMALFNPTDTEMLLEMGVRDQGTGVVTSGLALPPLPPQGTMALADVLNLMGLDFSCATLWFERSEENADTLPVVNAWKYLEPTAGVKYGQFLPVFPVWPASDQTTTRWITGLVHNSLNAERGHYGFVTKLTFLDPTLKDPNRVPWGSKKLILRLYDNQTGKMLRIDSLNLDNYGGYRHDYINRIFHLSDGQDFKAVTVQVEVPPGVSVIVTSSMLDNYTENAVVFPSQTVQ